MTKRRLVLFAAVLALLTVVTTVVLAYLRFSDPIAVRLFDQIQLGMTRVEVVAILGQPAWEPGRSEGLPIEFRQAYGTGDLRELGPAAAMGDFSTHFIVWEAAENYWLHVVFSQDGFVVRAALHAPYRPPTLFQRVRAWLGL